MYIFTGFLHSEINMSLLVCTLLLFKHDDDLQDDWQVNCFECNHPHMLWKTGPPTEMYLRGDHLAFHHLCISSTPLNSINNGDEHGWVSRGTEWTRCCLNWGSGAAGLSGCPQWRALGVVCEGGPHLRGSTNPRRSRLPPEPDGRWYIAWRRELMQHWPEITQASRQSAPTGSRISPVEEAASSSRPAKSDRSFWVL